jgi:peptide/nickel transport system permease protein
MGMGTYIVRRATYTVAVLFAASIVIFLALRVSPGTPQDALFNPVASPQAKQALVRQFHLNDPLPVQYGRFLHDLVTLQLGQSIKTGQPILQIVGTYGLNSLKLILAAIVITYGIAIPLGVVVAVRRDSWLDNLVLGIANLGMGLPNFVLALILTRIFATELGWLPLSGDAGFTSLILPAIALSAEGTSVVLRLVRSTMIEQLSQDYIRTLRAAGLSERVVVWGHALRNALIPIISLSALQIGSLVGYTAIVEIVFRWPGLGQQLVTSVLQRDYPVALWLSLILTASVVLANFAANIGYAYADPRVRASVRTGG